MYMSTKFSKQEVPFCSSAEKKMEINWSKFIGKKKPNYYPNHQKIIRQTIMAEILFYAPGR